MTTADLKCHVCNMPMSQFIRHFHAASANYKCSSDNGILMLTNSCTSRDSVPLLNGTILTRLCSTVGGKVKN